LEEKIKILTLSSQKRNKFLEEIEIIKEKPLLWKINRGRMFFEIMK
jgi:hypothetical protein